MRQHGETGGRQADAAAWGNAWVRSTSRDSGVGVWWGTGSSRLVEGKGVGRWQFRDISYNGSNKES